jgi:hypothetical protein
LWTKLGLSSFYDSSILWQNRFGYCQAVATNFFVHMACFVLLNSCSRLLWYHISSLFDDVCWMVSLFLNIGHHANKKKSTLNPFCTMFWLLLL